MNAKKSFETKLELSERWREYFQFLGKNWIHIHNMIRMTYISRVISKIINYFKLLLFSGRNQNRYYTSKG